MPPHDALKKLIKTHFNLYLLEASKIVMPSINRPRQNPIALYIIKPNFRN